MLNEQTTSTNQKTVTYSNPEIILNNLSPNVDLDHIYTEQNETNISHNRGLFIKLDK